MGNSAQLCERHWNDRPKADALQGLVTTSSYGQKRKLAIAPPPFASSRGGTQYLYVLRIPATVAAFPSGRPALRHLYVDRSVSAVRHVARTPT